ncbi:MAG: helix-turn-helix domain-containing protein [Oscillospiraceae bacterium]|nr:helix-turn-helix domain-containing protein [Oscillospiraceae bacterium]
MARTTMKSSTPVTPAMLLTAHEMAARSGIGENTLRRLMEEGQIDYLQIGSRKLLCEQAVWDYYERCKTTAIA